MPAQPKLPINVQELLRHRRVEGERIEYKKGWNPAAILRTLCAFANDFQNLGGGYVVVGVEERDGQPLLPPAGLSLREISQIQRELLNLGNAALDPHYHPLTGVHKVQGKRILVLWAPGGVSRPYKARTSLGGKKSGWAFYIRKHASTVQARGEDERELLQLAARVPFDDRYHQSAQLAQLAPYLMREFLQDVGSELAKEAAALSPEELGQRMNLVAGPPEALFPKNVGLLFFNERPYDFFPATQIDVVHFPDGPGGDHFEERVFRGPLGRIARDSVDFVIRNYLKESVTKHPDRPEAERRWNFPAVAVEEAIMNAVYHRSYEIREPVEVRITPEELVVLSHPGPDRSINMEALQAGRAVTRRYRNRRIGEFLKELELTEGRSTGVPKILRAMQQNGSPHPVFVTDEHRDTFMVRLPVRAGFVGWQRDDWAATAQVPPKYPSSTPQVTPQVGALLECCQGEMGRDQLQQAVGLTDRKHFARHSLNPALEQGLIEMTRLESPRSPKQKYRLTVKGRQWLARTATIQVPYKYHTSDHTSTPQVTPQVGALLECCQGEMGGGQLLQALGLANRPHFHRRYLNPALQQGLVEMTRPESPRSPKQQYRLTAKGKQWLASKSAT